MEGSALTETINRPELSSPDNCILAPGELAGHWRYIT